MKIYNKVVIEIETGRTIYEESYEYVGDILLMKGGGGGNTTVKGEVDYEYNRRMAAIAEQQQNIANEYFNYWKQYHKPMEIQEVQANREIIPLETGVRKAQLQSQQELTPLQTDVAKQQLGLTSEQLAAQKSLVPLQTQVTGSFLREAGNVNPTDWMGQAQTDVAQSFVNQRGQMMRTAGRLGLSPDDPRLIAAMENQNIDIAGLTAGARTKARRLAEQERFRRLGLASGLK